MVTFARRLAAWYPVRVSRRRRPRFPVRRGGRLAEWLSLAFVALLLVSHFARAGHLLLVAHERCAEHGELIHADAEHAAGDAAAHSPETASSNDGDAVAPGSAPSASDHEHCDAVAISHRPQDVAVTVDDVRLLDGYLLPWSLRGDVGARNVELLLLAPKNSPPA